MEPLKTQYGDSIVADFGEETWTFQMRGDFKVTAGPYAIIPIGQYEKLLAALKGIRNSMNVHPDCETDSEFEGMVSRCDEILEELEGPNI